MDDEIIIISFHQRDEKISKLEQEVEKLKQDIQVLAAWHLRNIQTFREIGDLMTKMTEKREGNHENRLKNNR
jgi:hypothetical protein